MVQIDKLKKEFLEYLEIEKGRSLKTSENYDRYLSKFFAQAKIRLPTDITDEKVRNFRLWLNRQTGINRQEGNNLKKNTQNYYLIAIRVFLKFLVIKNIASLLPERIELAKTSQRDLDL